MGMFQSAEKPAHEARLARRSLVLHPTRRGRMMLKSGRRLRLPPRPLVLAAHLPSSDLLRLRRQPLHPHVAVVLQNISRLTGGLIGLPVFARLTLVWVECGRVRRCRVAGGVDGRGDVGAVLRHVLRLGVHDRCAV